MTVEEKEKKSPSVLKRVMAILGIVIIVASIIFTIYLAVIGSDKFLAMMFVDLVVPVIIWVFLHFVDVFTKQKEAA